MPSTPENSAASESADQSLQRIRERRERRMKGKEPEAGGGEDEAPEGFLRTIRGWADALFFAFLLAMFIRTFVFELFMIPTGSMTPALIGDEARQVTEYDWDGDGQDDIVVLPPMGVTSYLQVHLRNAEGKFETQLILTNPNDVARSIFRNPTNQGKGRRDMIMVNKFSYWFSPPERGDIAVFKVPDRPPQYPFDVNKPVFIKRCVGLPGDEITLRPVEMYTEHKPGDENRLTPDKFGGVELIIRSQPVMINGEEIADTPFPRLHHFPKNSLKGLGIPEPEGYAESETYEVPEDAVMMFGDNQMSSRDSRYFGPVPLNHLRGKAIFRYFPLRKFGFLENGNEE